MSSRMGAYVSHKVNAIDLPSPNSTRGFITVEIRAYWPAWAGNREAVLAELKSAYEEAVAKVIHNDESSSRDRI